MKRSAMHTRRRLLWAGMSFLMSISAMPVVADSNVGSTPHAGSYCPSPDILLVTAEDLSASLDLVMRSRAALMDNDQNTAVNELAAAGTTLQLAASRGAAARTILLIDAIVQAKSAKNYTQMLTWFPVLHASLQTLADDATVREADNLVARAEDIMQRIGGGDSLQFLGEARHMLACDGLDIPLHSAIRAQARLMKQLGQQIPPQQIPPQQITTKPSAYDSLLDSLRNALAYTLDHSEN